MVKVIVALDLPTADEALSMAEQVRDHVAGFKIGLGLLHGPGPRVIGSLNELGRPVFADAKLHDIPSQVEAGARHLAEHGARWVTAHAPGGAAMLKAAVTGLAQGGAEAGILAVTVLTSIDTAEPELVQGLAHTAATAGCEGIVSSPHELALVAAAAPGLLRVTPGIRLVASDDDQARTATPGEAIAAGADYLVIGRPITRAQDPAEAARAIAHGS
jgi:orotidine-5'-phosphate decarboxylase